MNLYFSLLSEASDSAHHCASCDYSLNTTWLQSVKHPSPTLNHSRSFALFFLQTSVKSIKIARDCLEKTGTQLATLYHYPLTHLTGHTGTMPWLCKVKEVEKIVQHNNPTFSDYTMWQSNRVGTVTWTAPSVSSSMAQCSNAYWMQPHSQRTHAFKLDTIPPSWALSSNNTTECLHGTENFQVYKSHKINSLKTSKFSQLPDSIAYSLWTNSLVADNNEIWVMKQI